MHFTTSLLALGAFFCSSVLAQAPNTVEIVCPTCRTMSSNGSWFLVPMKKSVVQSALPSNYTLLPSVTEDKSIFPQGFPADEWPILVLGSAYGANIAMTDAGVRLFISALTQGEIYIPFVDRLKDGKTPFLYPMFNVIGGENGQLDPGLVPAIVGSTQGSIIYEGTFTPSNAPYSLLDPRTGERTSSATVDIVPNPASGPGVQVLAYTTDFFPVFSSAYTSHTFHSILNQPEILYTGQCLRNTQYFNETFAEPFLTNGTVTIGTPGTLGFLVEGLPASFAGVYKGVGGYAATSENIGWPNQDCAQAAAQVDPAATE